VTAVGAGVRAPHGRVIPIYGEPWAHLVVVPPEAAEACPTCRAAHCWFVARALPEPGRYRIQCVGCDSAEGRSVA